MIGGRSHIIDDEKYLENERNAEKTKVNLPGKSDDTLR